MLKWIGAALIVLGCGGCGMLMAANYRREEQRLRQFERIITDMVSELSCRLSPLTQILNRGADCAQEELKKIMLELVEELERQVMPDASCCMQAVLTRHPGLSDLLKELLTDLGRSLGRFDMDGQLRDLEAVSAACSRAISEHTAGRDNRIRSYQTLGICAGAALAILLL